MLSRDVSKITQLTGDSAGFDYTKHTDRCSLVFVDGSHAYDYAKADTETALKLVSKDGIVIWHDYGIWPGVTAALEEIDKEKGLGLKNIKGTSLVYWKNE